MTNDSSTGRPRVLIEEWLPVTELGIESRRERAAASALPPLSFLHVWWARRPLVASAAVVLAGLLPTWTEDLAAAYPDAPQVRTEKAYHRWLLHLVGIWGDPITARRAYDAAVASGQRIPNPYTYKQAFRNAIPREDIDLLHDILRRTWGALPVVADPTAGGGSIPFTAARLGIPVYANDLNGVAASILRAGVEIPARRGLELKPHLEEWGQELVRRVESRLKKYFPSGQNEVVATYLFTNAVTCPRTSRLVPLLPDKWLRKEKGKEAAVRLVTAVDGTQLDEPLFEVLTGANVDPKDAAVGSVGRGNAVSPYDNLVIDSGYIREQARLGRLTEMLYAVAVRTPTGERRFRAATQMDVDALTAASKALSDVRSDWEACGFLPTQEVPPQHAKYDVSRWGLVYWQDFFTDRQLLVHGTFAAEFTRMMPEVQDALGEAAADVLFELALMQGKALNWNARLSSWNVGAQGMRSVFDTHNFAFKWSFAEFEGASALYNWCLAQLIASYGGIASLVDATGAPSLTGGASLLRQVRVTQGSGAELADLPDGSVGHLCMDPPYYDNVMYAELADFFYVWEQHTLGRVAPEFFAAALCDKENEAVANASRFAAMGKRSKELADLDYEAKMTDIFAECRRVLRDDGVMSVMFTHKRADAWDTLGMGLLQAEFTVETSWPVNTERELSLHQANMNSAASTIMLVCRKRSADKGSRVFLDDIESEVRAAAREAVTRYRLYGIDGVDLLLSTYGPVLSVISAHWPVYSTEAGEDGRSRLLRPQEALDLAREEVVRLQRRRIVGREVQIDNHSDFVLIAWETFKATEFPFDEARRLALAVGGLDVDELAQAKIVEKKTGTVRLLAPAERLRRGGDDSSTGVRPDAGRFEYMNDAVDTVLYIAAVDGMSQAKAFLDRLGLTGDQRFLACVQGLVNAIPRSKVKGEWVVPRAGLLDTLVTAYLPDVTIPAEPEVVSVVSEQAALFD